MKILQKILSTMNKEGHENYYSFCRRWEANRERLENAADAAELIRELSGLLVDGEEARIEERQYLSITGNGYKYTTRIVFPWKK